MHVAWHVVRLKPFYACIKPFRQAPGPPEVEPEEVPQRLPAAKPPMGRPIACTNVCSYVPTAFAYSLYTCICAEGRRQGVHDAARELLPGVPATANTCGSQAAGSLARKLYTYLITSVHFGVHVLAGRCSPSPGAPP